MKKIYIALLLLFTSISYAQSNNDLLIETSTDQPLVVCGDEVTFTIKITNTSNGVLSSLQYNSVLPNGVILVNSEYTNENTPQEIRFSLLDIPQNEILTFTYTAKGDCTLLADFDAAVDTNETFSVTNNNSITYSLDGTSDSILTGTSESFNVNFPELFVKVKGEPNQQFALLEKDADGSSFNREIELANGGLGALRELRFFIDFDSRINFDELRMVTGNSSQIITPVGPDVNSPAPFIGLRRLEYLITDFSSIGDGDGLFEQNEKITFIDKVILDSGDCFSSMVTNYTAVYGCSNDSSDTTTFCEAIDDKDATSLNYLSFVEGTPYFSSNDLFELVESGSLCGNTSRFKLMFTNNGNGSSLIAADAAFNLFIENKSKDIFNVPGQNKLYIGGKELLIQENMDFEFSANPGGIFSSDPDGVGVGLEDLDKDGIYDDLPVGATLVIDVELNIDWDPNYFVDLYIGKLVDIRLYANSNNTCVNNLESAVPVGLYFNSKEKSIATNNVPQNLSTDENYVLEFTTNFYNILTSNHALNVNSPTNNNAIVFPQNYLSRFKLPEAYFINKVTWHELNDSNEIVNSIELSWNEIEDNVFEVRGGGYRGRYEVNVRVGCLDTLEIVEDKIDWDLYLDACNDYSTLELIRITGTSSNVFTNYKLCGSSGPACDFATTEFYVKRNTFGYQPRSNGFRYFTKSELESQPRVTAQTPGIELDAAYPNDKVVFSALGKLKTKEDEFYNRISFKLTYELLPGTTQDLLELTNYGALRVDDTSYSLLPPQISFDSDENQVTYFFNVIIDPVSGSDIDLTLRGLQLQFAKQSEIALSKGVYQIPSFKGEFGGQKTNSIRGCGNSLGTTFELYIPYTFYSSESTMYPQCKRDIEIFSLNLISATGGDDFPAEYRPISQFEKLSYTIPDGYQLKINEEYGTSSFMKIGYNSRYYVQEEVINGNVLNIPSSNIFVLSADNSYTNFRIIANIEPICDDDTWESRQETNMEFLYKEFIDDPTVIKNHFEISNRNSTINVINQYNRPRFETTTNRVQEGFERLTDWPVEMCNVSSTNSSNKVIRNPWMAFELKPGDNSTILVGANDQNGDPIANDNIIFYGPINPRSGLPQNMLVKVGNIINKGVCTTVYPVAEYRVCENDVEQDIDLISSWACDTFPFADANADLTAINSVLDPGILQCQFRVEQEVITLRYKTGGLAWEVNRIGDEVDLCEDIAYTVKVTSSLIANVYDTDVSIALPEGVFLSDVNQIMYSFDGSNTIVPANFIQQNTPSSEDIIIKASDLVTSLLVASGDLENADESTIPGGLRLSGKNEIVFEIKFNSDCNYNPGEPIKFFLTGKTNCSDNISLEFDRYIPINGLVLPNINIDISADNFLVCNDLNVVTVNAENISANTVAQQQLVVTLPAGVSYDSTINGFPTPTSFSNGEVIWNMEDLNTITNQVFKINTRLDDLSLVNLEYKAETIQNGQAICITDNQVCELEVTTGSDTVEVTSTPFPGISINPISSIPTCEGKNVVVEVVFTDGTIGGAYTYDWNIQPIASNGNQFTFRPLNSTTLQVTLQSTANPSPSCSTSASLFVGIYPGADMNLTLVEGVSCVGQADGAAILTIVGEQGTGYVEQAPFTIVSATNTDLVIIGQELASGEQLAINNIPEGNFGVTLRDTYGCEFEQNIVVPVLNGNRIYDVCVSLLNCGATGGDVELSFTTLDTHSSITGTNYTGRVYKASGASEDIVTFRGTFGDTQTLELTDVLVSNPYIIELTAANGCIFTRSFSPQRLTVFATINEPNGNTDLTVCFANQLRDVSFTIGNNINDCTDYTIPSYTILVGQVDDSGDFIADPQVYNNVSDGLFSLEDLGPGEYKVVLRPNAISGYTEPLEICETERVFSIRTLSPFSVDAIGINPACFGQESGRVEAVVYDNYGEISYTWTNLDTGEIVSRGYMADNLPAGSYELVVFDETGCGPADPVYVTLENPERLAPLILEDIQTSCDAIAGAVSPTGGAIKYTSGVPPYFFSWYQIKQEEVINDDGTVEIIFMEELVYEETLQTSGVSRYPGIEPGDYKVVLTDTNGCFVETEVTAVTQPPVARSYNLCLSWRSKPEKERNTSTRTTIGNSITASNIREQISEEVEKCVSDAKDQLAINADALLNDAKILDDEIVLDYVQGTSDVYHFTLYYYDRAGNLVRTVPPEGVRTVDDRTATAHTYVTGYDYNSIAQLSSQNTPDGGTSQFVYNDIGQLWYSQNERQIKEEVFSYVIYDELGRVREGGEAKLNEKTFPDDFLIDNQANPQVAFDIVEVDKIEYIQTTYNDRIEDITYFDQTQRFLRNNVSFINNKDKNGNVTKTYYSYDPHGNVEWCIQELPGIGRTTVAYSYDLISGNVNEVFFNKGRVGEYRHRYTYDEDNRIVAVQTSKDGYVWDEDARYDYYLHGPLMRTEIGEDKVQGIDYTYTIHGWLKGINTPNLEQSAFNPDGNNTRSDIASKHAKDEFGMALGYYQGDFTRDGVFNSALTVTNPFNLQNQVNGVQQNLYNGNISTWTSQVAEEAKDKNRDSYITGNTYRYDQLNRIKSSTSHLYSEATRGYGAIGGNADAYKTSYTYDSNGNIMTLKRHKEDGQLLDDLEYHYDISNPNLSNQLTHVKDNAGQVSAEINDLPNQPEGNYEYDDIGQLVRDHSEGLTYKWTAAGKVSEIIPDYTNDPDTQKVYMSFTYDGMGMRAVKQVNRMPYNTDGEGPQIYNPEAIETTYYTCDASGNVMGIYKREDVKVNSDDPDDNTYTATFSISERPIYGSDRVGQDIQKEVVYTKTYAFDTPQNYEAVAVQFRSNITNANENVFLVQNDNTEVLDTNGDLIEVAGTTLTKAKVDKAFNAIQYEGLQQENEAVLPFVTNNNVFFIEDEQGEMFGYGVVVDNYFTDTPDRSVLLVYDAEGNLMQGLDTINADSATPIDPKAKTVVVKHPYDQGEYLMFYRDIDAGLHCASIVDYGFGPQITNHQNFAYSNYGRHMAVINDEQNKKLYLYTTMHTEGTVDDDGNVTTPAGTNLVRFVSDTSGNVEFESTLLPEYFDSFDAEGNGELQIAADGSAISLYHNTSLPAQWTASTEAEIRTWQLDPETKLPIAESVQVIAVSNGNIGKGSLINTGDEIYYTQYTQDVTTNVDTKVVKRASDNQVVANTLGDLRINKDDKLYQFASEANTGQEWDLDTQISIGLNNLPNAAAGNTGYQPYQPYTILKTAEEATNGIVYRNVGDKYYELKDHLGNVRVVVGDRKNLDPATGALTASVESYNDYYPFGMLKPNRHKSSDNYRYGFQGQEKDNELKGEGNSVNYKYRMHDPRLGRFFAVDPLTQKYPFYTPYSFSGNRVIDRIELEGLEPRKPIGLSSNLPWYVPEIATWTLLSIDKEGKLFKVMESKGIEWKVEKLFWDSNHVYPHTYNKTWIEYDGEVYDAACLGEGATIGDLIQQETLTEHMMKQEEIQGNLNSASAKAEAALGVASFVDGIKNIYRGWKAFKTIQWPKITNKAKMDVQTNPFGKRLYWKENVSIVKGSIMVNGKKFTGVREYIVTKEGKLILGKGHDFMSGNADSVAGAGKIYIDNGKIIDMNNDTGHFLTSMKEMIQTLKGLRKKGIVDKSLKKPTDLYGN